MPSSLTLNNPSALTAPTSSSIAPARSIPGVALLQVLVGGAMLVASIGVVSLLPRAAALTGMLAALLIGCGLHALLDKKSSLS